MEPEADTWIFVHARQGGDEGCKSILIKANDTDVLIIVVSVLLTLQEVGLQELWIACGQGWNLRWIPIHELFFCIGLQRSKGILFLHAFTDCDVVSSVVKVKAGTHCPNRWMSEAFGETQMTLGTNMFGVFSCVGSFRSSAEYCLLQFSMRILRTMAVCHLSHWIL